MSTHQVLIEAHHIYVIPRLWLLAYPWQGCIIPSSVQIFFHLMNEMYVSDLCLVVCCEAAEYLGDSERALFGRKFQGGLVVNI